MSICIGNWIFQLAADTENLLELNGTIKGPTDTPYEGATYQIEIRIPEAYPFQPPRFRFITKVMHTMSSIPHNPSAERKFVYVFR